MKRIIFGLFLFLFIFCLVGCEDKNINDDKKHDNVNDDNHNKDDDNDDRDSTHDYSDAYYELSFDCDSKIYVGDEYNLSKVLYPSDKYDDVELLKWESVNPTFTSDNPDVLSIDDNGNIKALKAGNASITISYEISGVTKTESFDFEVLNQEVKIDLKGYTIKIAQSLHSLGVYDARLGKETENEYYYYDKDDREYKIKAIKDIEEKYNCKIAYVAYPDDAPWGPQRWNYIINENKNEKAEYDFYVIPDSIIPTIVKEGALLDLTDFYNLYGNNYMNKVSINSGTYKDKLYTINERALNMDNILYYNLGLFEKIKEKDSSIKEPAQMYLDGDWNFDTFKEYCIKVQNILNSFNTDSKSYYALTGGALALWSGLVNASGVKVFDIVGLSANMDGLIQQKAAKTLRDITLAGAMDTDFELAFNSKYWSDGLALFSVAQVADVSNDTYFNKRYWSDNNAKLGFVPFPTENEESLFALSTTDSLVMSSGRSWAYKDYGDDCTTENIYRIYMDYLNTSKQYYEARDGYNYEEKIRAIANNNFSSEASVKVYMKIMLGEKQEDGSFIGGLGEDGIIDPFVASACTQSTSYVHPFKTDMISYMKRESVTKTWEEVVSPYKDYLEKEVKDFYE